MSLKLNLSIHMMIQMPLRASGKSAPNPFTPYII